MVACCSVREPQFGGLLNNNPFLFNFCRAQELCESRGGHPGLPVLNNPEGLCGPKATSEGLCGPKATSEGLCGPKATSEGEEEF